METSTEECTGPGSGLPDTSPGVSEFHGTSDGRPSDHDHVRETTHIEISLRGSLPTTSPAPVPTTGTSITQATVHHKGKAPPVDSFTGMDPEFWLDDWIPALLRASKWYGWSEDEELIQLA